MGKIVKPAFCSSLHCMYVCMYVCYCILDQCKEQFILYLSLCLLQVNVGVMKAGLENSAVMVHTM